MKTFTQDEVLERYEHLPKRVKDALFASTTTDKMLEIGKKNGLLIDKVGMLAEETGYVMLGLIHPEEYRSRLIERLGLTDAQANLLITDVNREIFREIQGDLREAKEKEEEETTERPKSFAVHVTEKGPFEKQEGGGNIHAS